MYKCVHFTHHQPSLSGVRHCAVGLWGETPDDLHTVSYRKTRMHDNVCELKDKTRKKKTYKCYSQKFHFTYMTVHCDKKKSVAEILKNAQLTWQVFPWRFPVGLRLCWGSVEENWLHCRYDGCERGASCSREERLSQLIHASLWPSQRPRGCSHTMW